MNFETKLRARLETFLQPENSSVVVESVESLEESEDVLRVRFHLEGEWKSPAVFTFPFAQSVPLEDSLARLHDFITRNWQRAHLPPQAAKSHIANL